MMMMMSRRFHVHEHRLVMTGGTDQSAHYTAQPGDSLKFKIFRIIGQKKPLGYLIKFTSLTLVAAR